MINNVQKGLIDIYQNLPKGFYKVEAIIGRRIKFGKKQYLIKWKDFPEEQATWEPIKNLENIYWEVEKYDRDYPEDKEINISDDENTINKFKTNKSIFKKRNIKKKNNNKNINNESQEFLNRKVKNQKINYSKISKNKIEFKEIIGIRKIKENNFSVSVRCFDKEKKKEFNSEVSLPIIKRINPKLLINFLDEIQEKNIIIEII
jgi:hypothetical protein